jgi:hypothetical protein
MAIRLTKDARAEVVQLYRAGWSMTAIARYWGVTRDTVRRIIQSAGLPARASRRGIAADAGRSERAWVRIRREIRDLQRCPACLGQGMLDVQVQAETGTLTVRCRDAHCQYTWIRRLVMDDWVYKHYTSGGATERDPNKVVALVREFWRREMPDRDFADAVIEFAKRYPRYGAILSGIQQ